MAINFPSGLDTFFDPNNNTLVENNHPDLHSDINSATEALEAKVGINNSLITTSHDYKIKQLETNNTGTNTGDQVAGDFAHDSLASITGTAGEYNHPTDAQMTVLGNTSNTNTGDQTYIAPRVVTTTSDATAVIDVAVTDVYQLTAMAAATTFSFTGTPTDGKKIMIRFKDDGITRALTWTGFTDLTGALPTTTTVGKRHYVGVEYNSSASEYHVLAVQIQP